MLPGGNFLSARRTRQKGKYLPGDIDFPLRRRRSRAGPGESRKEEGDDIDEPLLPRATRNCDALARVVRPLSATPARGSETLLFRGTQIASSRNDGHAARAIAFAAKGNVTAARAEQRKFLALAKGVPAETTLGNNPATAIFAVAMPMVEGEILVRERRLDEGFAALRQAAEAEDKLHYDEPPGWILPARHALGANLMAHGRYAAAEQVYRDDLARLPKNGWSLFGLGGRLEPAGKTHRGRTRPGALPTDVARGRS